jgi:hypothetical protein
VQKTPPGPPATTDLRSHRARGALGGRKRWGPQRIVRLDQLPPTVAATILALIAADAAARATTEPGPGKPES